MSCVCMEPQSWGPLGPHRGIDVGCCARPIEADFAIGLLARILHEAAAAPLSGAAELSA